MDNCDDLVEAAEKATPGPWTASKHGVVIGGTERTYANGKGQDQLFMACVVIEPNGGDQSSNAVYIALAAPSRILALVKELREARKDADSKQYKIDELMMEHCPDEMTSEQVTEWARHQVPADTADAITDNVIDLSAHRTSPHTSGMARCLDCKHEWQGVAPTGTLWLECPACALVRGRFVYQHQRQGLEWQCRCGNDLFHATPDGVYCPNCGVWQDFSKAK